MIRRLRTSPPLLSLALLAASVLPLPAFAQEVVSASPDVTIDLGAGVLASDDDVAVDNQLGLVALENLGSLPVASDVVALGLDANGDRLIAFDTTTPLAGGVVARPGDVVRFDGANYSIEFDASAAGLATGAATDAVSLAPDGLLLSFETTTDLGGGLVAADEDLVRWNGAAFSIALDGSAAGAGAALDVDAAQDLGGGAFLVSFDTTGAIGGVVFDDEDVLRFDGSMWTLEFDASAAHSVWARADLDAVMVPEPDHRGQLGAGLFLLLLVARLRRARTSSRRLVHPSEREQRKSSPPQIDRLD